MFKLTEDQELAVKKISALKGKRFSRPYVFRLRGFAGTGKSTIMKVVHEEVGDLVATAPTGKAALRLAEVTGMDTGTIHRWLYTPQLDGVTGALKLTRKPLDKFVVPESNMLVIDEASMVDIDVWEDVFETCGALGMNIVCVGDGFQLPPVVTSEQGPFNLMDDAFNCDDGVTLTKVMRQAEESYIIRASMAIRTGNVFEAMLDVPRVFEKNLMEGARETYQSGDGVVICHANTTRHSLNEGVRKQLFGESAALQDGEPLLVLKNNYGMDPNSFNGEILKFNRWVGQPKEGIQVVNWYQKLRGTASFGLASVGDYDSEVALAVEEIGGSPDLEKLGTEGLSAAAKTVYGKKAVYLSANYGYTLTCHKSQGSEWKRALVVVEPTVGVNSLMGRRWLYTAVTRAKEDLSVCFVEKKWR